MLLRVDKYFIEELNKNGYNIDFKTLTGIYRDSRNNPDVIRKKKWKELKDSGVTGYFKWVEEELEWIEISEEEHKQRKQERLKELERWEEY